LLCVFEADVCRRVRVIGRCVAPAEGGGGGRRGLGLCGAGGLIDL
jgi:hypothetical protein